MTTSAHSPRGTASDSLLLQVNSDNILQVRNAYLAQQLALAQALRNTRNSQAMVLPGQDPISIDFAPFFDRKIGLIVDRVRSHVEELREATRRLSEAAREYGHTEEQVEQSFKDFQARNAVVATPGPPLVMDR